MSKVTLKPCPFCGSTDIQVHYYDPSGGRHKSPLIGSYRVRCTNCYCTIHKPTMTEAEEAWNKRFNSVADATNIHKNS